MGRRFRSCCSGRFSSYLFLRGESGDYPCPGAVHDRIKMSSEVGEGLDWRLQRVVGPGTSIATTSQSHFPVPSLSPQLRSHPSRLPSLFVRI